MWRLDCVFFRIHTCHGKLSKFGTSAQQEIQIINSYSEADNVLKMGKPSWRSLVRGLRDEAVRQNGIANEIAKEHPTRGMFALYTYVHVWS